MANESEQIETAERGKASRVNLWWALLMCLLAGAAGVSLPILVPDLFGQTLEQSSSAAQQSPSGNRLAYLPFGELTVNLDEGRMNRYLRLKMSLQIRQQDQTTVQQALTTHELILRNWLLSHLSDKTLDEIRGKAGQNLLRREIRIHFNTVLFADGQDRIHDILFEEFNVQ